MEIYKTRLVVRGNTQREGIDFTETFSPVVKMTTIRTIIALAAHRHWDIFQIDVNNAFLHGDLHEEVCMKMPEGIPNPSNKECQLQKSLYGLKQASRQWFAKLHSFLLQQGHTQSHSDSSLFLKVSASHITIVGIYVDDILITSSHHDDIVVLKHHLHSSFGIKDLGLLHCFLDLEVTYLPAGTSLKQQKFTNELLQDTGFLHAKPAPTPLPLNCKLTHDAGNLLQDPSYYRTIIVKLNFLTHIRPDLSYTLQFLSQFMQPPRASHFLALEHTLRYLAGSSGQGILL